MSGDPVARRLHQNDNLTTTRSTRFAVVTGGNGLHMEHRKSSRLFWSISLLCGLLLGVAIGDRNQAALAAPPRNAPDDITITMLRQDGGRVDWSKSLNIIAYDRRDADGDFDVFFMNPDGSNDVCLTCSMSQFTGRHVGNPAWYPNGNFLAVQAEKAQHAGNSDYATPGLGVNNDIYLISRWGQILARLTDVAEGMGVLHPHFSGDGAMLTWAERIADSDTPTGIWALKVLYLNVHQPGGENTILGTVFTYQPLGEILYETHGFTPDNEHLIFSAFRMPDDPAQSFMDIYKLNLSTGEVAPLTLSYDEWDEHAQFSPDGTRVLWMSSRDCDCNAYIPDDLFTDFWVMNASGANKTRITFFNLPGHPHYIPDQRSVAADNDWSPDGTKAIIYIQVGTPNRPYDGSIALLTFPGTAP